MTVGVVVVVVVVEAPPIGLRNDSANLRGMLRLNDPWTTRCGSNHETMRRISSDLTHRIDLLVQKLRAAQRAARQRVRRDELFSSARRGSHRRTLTF